MTDPVSLSAVQAAASLLEGRVERTRLLEVPESIHRRPGVELYLKLECEQVSGAFKARGARHFLARLTQGECTVPGSTVPGSGDRPPAVSGVVTYSSGNHGRAVAEAATAFGLPALVTVPDHVDLSKERAIVAAGAEAVRAGPTSESRKTRALEIAAERGWVIVPPFDHEWIVAGQGTAMLEVIEDLDRPPVAVWAPVGGGGLAAGCAAVLRASVPETTLHTVEPVGAACFAASARAGRIVRLDGASSIADGLLPLSVGTLNYHTLVAARFEAHTVGDDRIVESFRILRRQLEVHCETSGAVAATPILSEPDLQVAPGIHVAIVSGGNIAEERLAEFLG